MPDTNGWLSIRSTGLNARIDPLGAQLSQLQDAAGRDLLKDGDATFWGGRAPLLFPIVGALQGGVCRWQDRRYALPRHGFARGRPFEVVEVAGDAARLRLRADPSTLAIYPFEFVLDVSFRIVGSTVSLRVSVGNAGRGPMPASFGFHPAFRWPLPYGQERGAHFIEFETDEPGPIRRLNAAGLLEPAPRPTPVQQRRLLLHDGLFEEDAVIFDRLRSHAVTYGADSGPGIRVRFPETPYLGLWSKPGAPFVCIEPWHGIADPNGFTGTLDQKPGIVMIESGEAREFAVDISLLGV